ncbi:hypothetical protein LTR17_021025 [Elasticomyces elasticus]|nr:hypothetical protein LTR17_021025 [Elasticomyces elasticus]
MSLMAPVEKNGFAFAGDVFCAQTSDHHLHRRATFLELKELFQPAPGTTDKTKDPPAHWYRVSADSLWSTTVQDEVCCEDAFNAGRMVVPQNLLDLETELRKDWNKNERQSSKTRKEMTLTSSAAAQGEKSQQTIKKPGRAAKQGDRVTTVKRAGKKRKLNDNVSDVIAASSNTSATARPSERAGSARKQRTQSTTAEKAKSAPAFARRSIPFDRGSHCESEPSALAAPATLGAHLRLSRQTAKRSRPFNPGTRFDSRPSLATVQAHEAEDFSPGARTKRPLSTCRPVDVIDEDDVAMQDASCNSHYEGRDVSESVKQEDACPSYSQSRNLVDLIGGMYNVQTSINGEWDEYNGLESTILPTFHDDQLWGSYDFGLFNGVIRMTEGRRNTSRPTIDVQWRGTENNEHIISYDNSRQTGQITFHGDGDVSGTFHEMYGVVSFQGLRARCQQTGGEQTYLTMQREWHSYSEEAFETARVRRW